MNRSRRTTFAAIAAVTAAIGLSGCGSEAEAQTEAPAVIEATPDPTPDPVESEPADEPEVLADATAGVPPLAAAYEACAPATNAALVDDMLRFDAEGWEFDGEAAAFGAYMWDRLAGIACAYEFLGATAEASEAFSSMVTTALPFVSVLGENPLTDSGTELWTGHGHTLSAHREIDGQGRVAVFFVDLGPDS